MVDLFLPKEFRVNKRLDKEFFLKNANLTPAEYRDVEKYLKKIEITYDIQFSDKSELLLLDTEVEYMKDTRTLGNISKCIAAAIPQTVIIIAHEKEYARFVAFERKENQFNSKRTRIMRYVCSPFFDISNVEVKAARLLVFSYDIADRFQSAEACNRTAFFAIEGWKALNKDPFFHNLDVRLTAEDRAILRIMNEEGSAFESEQRYRPYDEEDPMDYYDEWTQKQYNTDCAVLCYGLFLETIEEHYLIESEESWLVKYVYACNELANILDLAELDDKALRNIKRNFDDKVDYRCSKSDIEFIDPYELIEILKDYFVEDYLDDEYEEDDEDE